MTNGTSRETVGDERKISNMPGIDNPLNDINYLNTRKE
jgi:hypothetical protein